MEHGKEYKEFKQAQLEANLKKHKDLVLEVGWLFNNEGTVAAMDRLIAAVDPRMGYYGLMLWLIAQGIGSLEDTEAEELGHGQSERLQ